MEKYTPGPWDGNGFYAPNFVHGAIDPTSVRYVWSDKAHCDVAWIANCVSEEEQEANARLMAAAPDLLDALCSALPFVEDAAEDEIYKSHRVHKVLDEIRKAIFKATGESK